MGQLVVDPEKDFHVVIQGQAVALSLDALASAYEGGVITEESLLWQPGFPEWLRLDFVLEQLDAGGEEQEEVAPSPSVPQVNLLSVQLAPGETKQMTVEQVHDGLRLGVVELEMLALQPGGIEWKPLGSFLSSIPAPAVSNPFVPARQVSSPARLAPEQPKSVLPAPEAVSRGPSLAPPSRVPPPSPVAPSMAPSRMAAPSLAPQSSGVGLAVSGVGPGHQQSFPPAAFASGSPALAPARMPTLPGPGGLGSAPSAPMASAPMASAPSLAAHSFVPRSAPAASVLPASIGPVEVPDDDSFLAPKKSKPWVGIGLAAAAVFVGAFALYRNGVADSVAAAGQPTGAAEPDVTTPRGMNTWLAKVSDKYELDRLSDTAASAERTSGERGAKFESTLPDLSKLDADADVRAQKATEASSAASAFGAKLSGKNAEPTTAKAPSKSTYRAPAAAKQKSKPSSNGLDAYDPMNGAL